MVHLYTGDGKGKTTAAIGLSMRMAGTGKAVLFAQFLKGSRTSELETLRLIPNIHVFRNPKDLGFLFQMSDEDKRLICKWHNQTLRALLSFIEKEENTGLVVLDEVTYAAKGGHLDQGLLDEVFSACQEQGIELVLTGQDPPREMWEMADYITEMKKIRHPFDKGIKARKGVEF